MGRYPSGNSDQRVRFPAIPAELAGQSPAQAARQTDAETANGNITLWPEVCYLCHSWLTHQNLSQNLSPCTETRLAEVDKDPAESLVYMK